MSVEEARDEDEQDEEGEEEDGQVVLGVEQEPWQRNGDVVAAGAIGVAVLLEVLVSSLISKNLFETKEMS